MIQQQKLKHYYVTGILIDTGRFVDRFGRPVEFTGNDQFIINDTVPIYFEHGGPIVGFATRFYTTNNKLCFDGYVFDSNLLQKLMSDRPGISAELIQLDDGFLVVGVALTSHPAIENAQLQGVIALSKSIATELEKFLKENGIDNAKEIAKLVDKFLAQFKYPAPDLKRYEVKMSEAAQTIEELQKQVEELQKQLEEKDMELKNLKLSQTEASLIAEITKICADVDLSDLPDDPEQRIVVLKSLLATLKKISNLKAKANDNVEDTEAEAEATGNTENTENAGNTETMDNDNMDNTDNAADNEKLEFSASPNTVEVEGNWDSAIEMYLNTK